MFDYLYLKRLQIGSLIIIIIYYILLLLLLLLGPVDMFINISP